MRIRNWLFITLLFFHFLLNCDEVSTRVEPMPVIVKVSVYHSMGDIECPTNEAIVDIVNTTGELIKEGVFLSATTNQSGLATIVTDTDFLLPKNTYKVKVYYPASKPVEKVFSMPQYPNNFREYILNLKVVHEIGNDPNYAPSVLIKVFVEEQEPGKVSYRESVGANVGLYNPDGQTTPVPENYVYHTYTNNEGYAELEVSSDYFIPGRTYAVKVLKNGYKTVLEEFDISTTPEDDVYMVTVSVSLNFD